MFVILRISLEVVFCQQERDRADVPTLILYEDLKVFYFFKNKREFGISLKFKITVVFVWLTVTALENSLFIINYYNVYVVVDVML